MKRTFPILSLGLLIPFAVVTALFLYSKRELHQPGSFLRTYVKGLKLSALTDVKFNSWYIAGISDSCIYLGNITAPYQILIANHDLTKIRTININFQEVPDILYYKSAQVTVRGNEFYYVDSRLLKSFKGTIYDWIAKPYRDNPADYNVVRVMNDGTLAVRTYLSNGELALGKIQLGESPLVVNENLLKKQFDGIFCTDGILNYNEDLNKLIYTYYYRNEYLVLSDMLDLQFRGHLIDTFSIARIKSAYVATSNGYRLVQSKLSNRDAWSSGNHLYILSDNPAVNDSYQNFDEMNVIDVYDLSTSLYEVSFLILTDLEKSQVSDFQIFDDRLLIALFDNSLAVYELNDDLICELTNLCSK